MNANFSFVSSGQSVRVAPDRALEARHIDKNKDGKLEDSEILAHLQETDSYPKPGEHEEVDTGAVLREFKEHLSRTPSTAAAGFHSYQELTDELGQLAADHPDLAQRVSLGKTSEGRDIWALKISKDVDTQDTSTRTGVVITGGTHAREWIAPQIPLALAHEMLEHADDPAMAKRLGSAETWLVPLVNPDGYEYSRNEDGWWRKNRRPVETDANGLATSAIGVDPDRNYFDGRPEHLELWRPAGDTSQSTADDFPMTSDDPGSECYRGPAGASEVEIKSLLELELGHANIRGVIDHHSYGNLILYPWGHSSDPVPNVEMFKEIGNSINAAMGNSFTVEQSAGLYPDSGESDDCQYVNGLTSFILETGRSFHPNPSDTAATTAKTTAGNLAFIDEIIDRAAAGTLPEKQPWTNPWTPAPPAPQPPAPQPPAPQPPAPQPPAPQPPAPEPPAPQPPAPEPPAQQQPTPPQQEEGGCLHWSPF